MPNYHVLILCQWSERRTVPAAGPCKVTLLIDGKPIECNGTMPEMTIESTGHSTFEGHVSACDHDEARDAALSTLRSTLASGVWLYRSTCVVRALPPRADVDSKSGG